MKPLKLRDCLSEKVDYYRQPEAIIRAVDELNNQFANDSIDIVSLQNYNPRSHFETPITYEIKSYKNLHNHLVIDCCVFTASHYIGRFTNGEVSIAISPRFGNKIFNYLISYATNLYLPMGQSDIETGINSNSYWLIGLLWKSMLNKALTMGQIPKEYQTFTNNQKSYRGRLSINKHIHANICNASKFYCTYKKLSMDNVINNTIRCAYKTLKSKGLSSLLSEFEEYDKRLESLGVSSTINPSLLSTIRYTRMTAPYQPVINISKTILANKSAESSEKSNNLACSYFIDMSEIWEMYLLKVLQRNLPKRYTIYSPNSTTGIFLLENNMRELRPDIIIELNGRVLVIIDAKYKDYHLFGKTATDGVQREDLYQMSTYLYHYGTSNKAIAGIFTSPVYCQKEDVYCMKHNDLHYIGLINLNIEDKETSIDTHIEEISYVKRIEGILKRIE